MFRPCVRANASHLAQTNETTIDSCKIDMELLLVLNLTRHVMLDQADL